MRALPILVVLSFASPLLLRAQSVPATAESPAPVRTYHLLREDDDWSFLADPAQRQEFWDPIKYVQLRPGRDDWFLSIGAKLAKFGNRLETAIGDSSRCGTPISTRGTCSILICITANMCGRSWN